MSLTPLVLDIGQVCEQEAEGERQRQEKAKEKDFSDHGENYREMSLT